MSDHIWLSNTFTDTSICRRLTSDMLERDRAEAIRSGDRNQRGEPLGPECYPTVIWPTPDAGKGDVSPSADLFKGAGQWFVSGRFAELLRQFEMGDARLYPVSYLHADRETPVKGEWFGLNFGNQKAALLPDRSTNLFRPSRRREAWLPQPLTDMSLAFSPLAREGAAIWIDLTLIQVFCLSGPLGDAMREQGITKGFKGLGDMVRGRVVAG